MSVRVPPEITSMGIPSRKASPMPLMACVTPAAGTMTSVPIVPPLGRLIPRAPRGRQDDERPERPAAGSADPVGRKGRSRLVRDEHRLDLLRAAEFVVDLRVVHARDPERVRHGKLLEGVPHEPCAGPFRADPDRPRHTDAPAIVRAATRPVRTQLPRNVPSREPMPWMPPPPKPAASPTA